MSSAAIESHPFRLLVSLLMLVGCAPSAGAPPVDEAQTACRGSLRDIDAALQMKAMDHGNFPGGMVHQQTPGEALLPSRFPETPTADLIAEKYLPAESATCPAGGLYSVWFPPAGDIVGVCTAHGVLINRSPFRVGRLVDDVMQLEDGVLLRAPSWVALCDAEGLKAGTATGFVSATWEQLARPGALTFLDAPPRLVVTVAGGSTPGNYSPPAADATLEMSPAGTATRLRQELGRYLKLPDAAGR